MSLGSYKKKRDFSESPEPLGGKPDPALLRFVVQKHAASHLHYDFRLELDGVLKSWAVPKGPSDDPAVKRLAMMVEDHPYDYRTFEGVIPSGYGKGTVMVWDEGTYVPAESDHEDKAAMSKLLRRQLKAGKLKIKIKGSKLKGTWTLVKAPARGENAWLLFKIRDRYASRSDILKKDKSVLSGRSMEQIKDSPEKFWQSHKPGKTNDLLKAGTRSAFSTKLKPMLATLVDEPFDEAGWLYEIKWDGYRALAFLNKGKVDLLSRNQKSFNDKFYPLVTELAGLKLNAILDGEVVVVNEMGFQISALCKTGEVKPTEN